MNQFLTSICLIIMGLCAAQMGRAQAPAMVDTTRKLEIIKANRYTYEKRDSANSFLSLAGQVQLRQEGTLFFADSAVINQNTNVVEAFGNIHINDGDSIHTYARYLRYRGNEKLAYLRDNVKLADNKGSVLTTKELNYDMNTGMAVYTLNGKVVNKKTILTSKTGTYYDATKDVIFTTDVQLNDPQYKMLTDSLQYNSITEIATFISPTTIISGKRKIFTRSGYYDIKMGKAYFEERPKIVDSTYTIESNQMAFDDKLGQGQFKGNVSYVDTANGIVLLANSLSVNNKTSSFLATDQPLMILKQDKDSLFITADTLLSGKLTDILPRRTVPVIKDTTNKPYTIPKLEGKDSSMNRFFEAWHNVRIFSDSMQAVADSMFYAGTDSAFRLFGLPIVWSNDSQITADTMYLFTENKSPSLLRAFYNGFVINRLQPDAFNQLQGNTINAWFKEGNIDYVRAKGRAESIYYATDEQNRFIGMNRSNADAIEMYFAEKKPIKVKFINDLKGVTYPITQIPPSLNRLEGFNWQDAKRPKSYFELLGR